ncbi:MAG: hypothetical protein IKM96_01440 [Clostridiales bacterium]|nr:hypothetical protein [Clostridiales bacterium]
MFKRAVALVVTAAMALGLAACNTETTEATASIYTKVTESMMSLNEDGVKAVNAYKELLKVNKDSIQIIEKYFNVPTCGLHDINSDGIPEFYFFAATDSTGYSATFFVFTYDKGSDAAVKKIEIPNIMYLSGGGGGEYAVFTSPVALIVTRSSGGTESVTETVVYDMNFYKNGSYKLTQTHDAATEMVVNKYFANGSPADQTAYDQLVTVHIDQATMVLASNIQAKSEEDASPLLSKPAARLMNYEGMLSYLINLS